jgi:RHS repeat-associated protein
MKTKHIASAGIGLIALASLARAEIVGHEKYIYDGSGNIVEKSIDGEVTNLSYDISNRVTSTASAAKCSESISYDAADRPVSYTKQSVKPRRQLSYGYADKVIQAELGLEKTILFYNAEGHLVSTNTDGVGETYGWDGLALVLKEHNTFTNEAHISGGSSVLIDGEMTVSDYLGSTLSAGDKNFEATAYGEGLEGWLFTGKPYVREIGSYVFKYRNYSLIDYRWTSRVPIGFPDGNNPYTYVYSDPLSGVDPAGLSVTIYSGSQNEPYSDIAYKDPINDLNGPSCKIRCIIHSEWNVLSSVPADVVIDEDYEDGVPAENPNAEYVLPQRALETYGGPNITRTKFSMKVSARSTGQAPSFDLEHTDFNQYTRWIEQ